MGSFGEINDYGHAMKSMFLFDQKHINLNHGSFGSYPIPVRNALRGYQKLSEAAPDKYLRYQCVDLLDKSRDRISKILHVPTDECVFVSNATTGINTVLRNLKYQEKDCIIYFDVIYGAIEKTLASIVETNPQVQVRKVGHGQDSASSLPCTHADILNAFSQTISRVLYDGLKPKVAVFDTISSIPAVRLPFERLVRLCKEYGIISVIDGAHGVGQIPLNLSQLDADFFTSNCHKWLFTPRGCAVLHVPKRNQHLIRTTYPTSHGYVPKAGGSMTIRNPLPPSTGSKSDFVMLFQFVATMDNSPFYCIPAALNFRQNLCPGGEEGIYDYIRDVAQRGADLLATVLGTEVMDDMDEGRGSRNMANCEATEQREIRKNGWSGGLRDCAMANVLLPLTIEGAKSDISTHMDPAGAGSAEKLGSRPDQIAISRAETAFKGPMTVQKSDVAIHTAWMERTLIEEYNTFVPIFEYNGHLWTRVSGQIYLESKDFDWLGTVLKTLCERVSKGESLQPVEERMSRVKSRAFSVDLEALGRSTSASEASQHAA